MMGSIYATCDQSILSRTYVCLGDRGAMRSEERGVTDTYGR